jgi:predicted AAA+ superfamily ATPase
MAKSRGPTWEPKPEDYRRVFSEQNPWHETGKVPDALARTVERPLASRLWKRLKKDEPRRFQLVLGPRRVGKTTSLYQTVRKLLAAKIDARRMWWLRLDHPLLMRVRLDALIRSVQKNAKANANEPAFVFLDELTYAADWDLWLKTFYDEKWPVRIIGSSSSTAALRHRRVESGVGRWEEQYLAPYLFAEYLSLVETPVDVPIEKTLHTTIRACVEQDVAVADLAEPRRRFLLTGGFPELLIAGKESGDDVASMLLLSQRTLRNDAVERAIYKDIPQAFGIDNPLMLERVLYTLAGQVTGILSPSGICQSLDGLSQPTFDRYLAYLERAFLVFTLPNFSGSETSKQKRGRKLYFVDGAIRNAALQRGIAPLKDAGEMGVLLENMVAGHLHALSQQSQVRLYYWRDKHSEVDLIYDHPELPMAFEVGSSESHHRGGLLRFMERYPRFRGRCYFVSPSVTASLPEDNSDGIGTLPLDLLLLAVSGQAERELEIRLAS